MTDLPGDALRVVATVPINPDHAAEAGTALAALAAASREEQGCYAYDVFESAATPGTFVTIEAWRSEEDLNTHMSTDHVATAFEVLGPHLAGEVAVHPLKPV
ncbi:MAG: putative quinol monooxygenase [Nocardioides sp.]